MTTLIVFLRVIHIFCAVFWTGAAIMLAGFVAPTVKALGPDGGKFMRHLSGAARFPIFMNSSALLGTLSGLILFGMVHGFRMGMLQSGFGLSLSLGSMVGLAAFLHGALVQGRNAAQMGKLANELQAAGGPPPPEKLSQLQQLQAKVIKGGMHGAVLLGIAAIAMAAARYL